MRAHARCIRNAKNQAEDIKAFREWFSCHMLGR
jgi:hypothetical protein